MAISDLPAINASFNAISTVFISLGWWLIRRGFWRQHIACMITRSFPPPFLAGYLVYHAQVGEKSSGYSGLIAWFYFPILISHILLAFVTLPLVIATLIPVFRAAGINIAGSQNGRCRSGFMFRLRACSSTSCSINGSRRPVLRSAVVDV
jgi:putative membrane protein